LDKFELENHLSQQDSTADKSLNLYGLRCPHLLISVIAAIRSLKPDQNLQIRATDLNSPSSIRAWSRQSGNELLDMYQEDDCFVFLLKRNPKDVAQFDPKQATTVQKEESRKLTADR
jgi:TusA-related sulfurtransferase